MLFRSRRGSCTGRILFKVLHLLAETVDDGLQSQTDARQFAVGRLGAQRIGLAREFLRQEVEAPLGLSVLEIAHRHHIEVEGACEGSLACSTCHVVVEQEWFDKLAPASEDEEDMLDLAFGLTHTSRLGCQIRMSNELDGLVVKLPAATRNMMVDK